MRRKLGTKPKGERSEQLLSSAKVKDPVLQHRPTRKSVGYFGAVRLRDGKFIFARELNRFDAVSTWNFPRLLRRRSLNSRRRVIVITDNAKYHHAKLHSAWR